MLAKKYKSIVRSVINPFEGIYTVEFESLKRKYKYLPGQFLHLAIDNNYDGSGQWPESRCFSIQSTPKSDYLKITYAVKGNFTIMMQQYLKLGAEVWLKLPYGEIFQQPHSKMNTVFIAGGTGITPFLSLFNNKIFSEYKNPKIYLGFSSGKHNIYNTELKSIINNNAALSITYQDNDGKINIKSIFKQNGTDSDYFISGPPEMIRIFKNYLNNNNVPDNRILTDDWE